MNDALYDASGNQTKDYGGSTYTYDAENRVGNVNDWYYSYDANGVRTQKAFFLGGYTTYLYSGTRVLDEYSQGSLSKEYIYAGSALVATLDASGNPTYHFADQLSNRAETDANKNIVRTSGNYPFGENWFETGSASPDKWKFTSYERDGETGMDYALARHYDSIYGRFMSPDPLGGSIFNPHRLIAIAMSATTR